MILKFTISFDMNIQEYKADVTPCLKFFKKNIKIKLSLITDYFSSSACFPALLHASFI